MDMMNLLKKSLGLLLALVLCLGLAACGNADKEDKTDDVAGDDWRSTGIVVGSGTITHTGEDSVDVLVTVDENSAAFYRDEQDQILFDSVAFPVTVSDAKESFHDISFDDIDGDGESDVCVSFVHASGDSTQLVWIWDPDIRYVFWKDLSTFDSDSVDAITDYIGLWEYGDENLWLRIYEDSTWEIVNDQEDTIEYGTLWADAVGITLYVDGSGDALQLDRMASGELMDKVNGTVLSPVEEIQSSVPYFTRNGLEINAAVERGTFLLENGVSSYSGLGDGYNTDDCYWEIIKDGDYTHDGIREMQFDAVCYIPESSIPYFTEQFITVTNSELYDFYTGMWLTTATAYGDSQRGDNYYLHTINWQGNSYQIEFAYSTDWQYNVGDWAQVLTKSYTVYIPEDYDGLVFGAEAQPGSYEETAKRMQLDSISPEAPLMELATIDPYSGLYFSLCY